MRFFSAKTFAPVWKLSASLLAGVAIALVFVTRPLTAPLPNTIQIADMTWVEIRSAQERGYTSVIVPSGGIEQNGVQMALGKHDYIVQWAADRIARAVGGTLVAPVLSYVPQGDYDPPTGHLRYPGTIGLPDDVYARVLEGIARSLKAGGFKTICFIADHGDSMKPQVGVAERLSREWKRDGVRVVSIDSYYDDAAQNKWLLDLGETSSTIGFHAGIIDTSELMAVHPQGVDLTRLTAMPFTLTSTGGSGDPSRASAERGRTLIAMRVDAAVRQIKALRATQ